MSNDHREQAREIMCGPRKKDQSAWLLRGDLVDVHERIAAALSARDAEIERLRDWQEGLAATTVAWSEQRLSRDAEIKEVLEGLRSYTGCWCNHPNSHALHCLAAHALWEKVANTAPTPEAAPISKPLRRKSKKEQIADELRAGDLSAQAVGREDVIYGHHDSLPLCGEHVARMKRG